MLQKVEKLYLGNSNIAEAVSDKAQDEGTIRETMFLAWTKEMCKVASSSISDFEIDGKTFEVGGKNKKGKQIKDAAEGYPHLDVRFFILISSMEDPILNSHNKKEFPPAHSGDFDTHQTSDATPKGGIFL